MEHRAWNLVRPRFLRLALLLSIALSLAMIVARTTLDSRLLGLPGGLRAVLEPACLLIVDALVVIWATRPGDQVGQAVIREGTALGLIAGVLEIVHITVENYGHLDPRAESASTGAFLLGLLLLWAAAGYRVALGTSRIGAAMLAGSWCATVGMLLTVNYGFSQLFWDLPALERKNVLSPDFLRSGWTDLHAFTIADIFEAGFKVLLVGPVAGSILGALGGVAARLVVAITRRRRA